MSATLQQCRQCSRQLFPLRLHCPSCGGNSFRLVPVERGTVEQTTRLGDGTVLATVVPSGGPALIARVVGGADVGQEVGLSNDPHAAPGQAYIPFTVPVSGSQEDR